MLDGIQLYDQEEKPIDPNTKATAVFQSSISGADNVESALKALDNKINTNTEDLQEKLDEVLEKEGIIPVITLEYAILKVKEQSQVKIMEDNNNIIWHKDSYQFPTKDAPYTWKKTTTKIGDIIKISYELVTMLNTNKIQNIYLATNLEKVDIVYPKIEDSSKPEEEWENDYQVDDSYEFKTSTGDLIWSNYPVSLDANRTNLWMATRKYENEEWTPFQPENGARIGHFYTTSNVEQ